MGANYRSDIDAGFALGQVVARDARACRHRQLEHEVDRHNTDRAEWVGKDPLEPLLGTWKPWLMTRGDQFRPGPPPQLARRSSWRSWRC